MTLRCLSVSLLVFWTVFEYISSQVATVRPVSNNTGTSAATATNAICSRGITYQEFDKSADKLYFLATHGSAAVAGPPAISEVTSQQYLYALNGTLLAKFTNLNIVERVEAVGVTKEMTAYVCDFITGQYSLKIKSLDGVYTLEAGNNQNWIKKTMAMYVDPQSLYIHYIHRLWTPFSVCLHSDSRTGYDLCLQPMGRTVRQQ